MKQKRLGLASFGMNKKLHIAFHTSEVNELNEAIELINHNSSLHLTQTSFVRLAVGWFVGAVKNHGVRLEADFKEKAITINFKGEVKKIDERRQK